MSDWLNVIILGIIEGLAEFIPVSSTGHLLLAQQWLPEKSELFNVVIQCGAVLALVPIFWRRLQDMAFRFHEPENRDLVAKLVVAFFITGVGGVLMKMLGFKLPTDPMPVAWALLIGGFVIFAVEWWAKKRQLVDRVTWTVAIAVGFAQLLAAGFPGTSRSGATIIMALAFGLCRPRATEFSFLLSIPTMFAAGALELYRELKHTGTENESWSLLLLGTVASAISAFLVVKWLIRFVQSNTFRVFAYYRVIAGAGMLIYFWPYGK